MKTCVQCQSTQGERRRICIDTIWTEVESWKWIEEPFFWGPFCCDTCALQWREEGGTVKVRDFPSVFGSIQKADGIFGALATGYYHLGEDDVNEPRYFWDWHDPDNDGTSEGRIIEYQPRECSTCHEQNSVPSLADQFVCFNCSAIEGSLCV